MDKRYAAIALFLGGIALYSIHINYQEFVVRPREDAERAKQRSKEEMARDPLFSDVRYLKTDPDQLAAEEKRRFLEAAVESRKEGQNNSEVAGLHTQSGNISSVTTIEQGSIELTLLLDEQHIDSLSFSFLANEAKGLTNEELVAGVRMLHLRSIEFETELLEPVALGVGEDAETFFTRQITGKGKAYIENDSQSERTIVDVELQLRQVAAGKIQVQFAISRGEAPEEEKIITVDDSLGYRIFFSGEGLFDFASRDSH